VGSGLNFFENILKNRLPSGLAWCMVQTCKAMCRATKRETEMTTITIKNSAGTTLACIPQVTVRSDGTLWVNGNTAPLVNASGTLGADELAKINTAKAWDKIPSDNFYRLGQNAGGKVAVDDAAEYEAKHAAQIEAQRAAKAQRAADARKHDAIYNEGGEGYNPHR